MLVRRVILGLILIGGCALVYTGYTHWRAKRAMMGGDVYSDPMEQLTTTLKQAGAPPPAGTPAPADNAAAKPAASPGPTSPQPADTTSPPSAGDTGLAGLIRGGQAQKGAPATTSNATPATPQTSQTRPPGSINDTIAPNPPNGTAFAGRGRYQVYRQGNLTWRLDTESGHACVLFATEEEWRRPQVYRNGCASSTSPR